MKSVVKGSKFSGIGESLEAMVDEKDPRDLNLMFKNKHGVSSEEAEKVKSEKAEASKSYEEAQAQLKIEIQEDYSRALKAFSEDESYFNEFKDCDPIGKEVIVKLFKFKPSRDLAQKRGLGEKSLIISSKFDKQLKTTTEALYERYYPIVKVIKVGNELPNIQVGGLYTVPAIDIEGEEWNPDFLHYMNTFAKADNGKQGVVHVPEDMPQKLQSVDLNWKRYRFVAPGSVKESDGTIFLIPSVKLKTPYRV